MKILFFSKNIFSLIFGILLNSSQNFRAIFWQDCQCCKVAVLRSVLSINFAFEKWISINQLRCWAKKLFGLAQLFLQECQNCRLRVQRNFWRKFSLRKIFFQSVPKFERSFFEFLGKFFWLEKHNCLLRVSFQMNSPKIFYIFRNFDKNFSDFCQKQLAGLWQLPSMWLDESFEKAGTKWNMIYCESIPVGMSKLHSKSTRTFWWKFLFFESFVFFLFFGISVNFFQIFA